MREIRTSGSEGGAGREPRSYLYLKDSRLYRVIAHTAAPLPVPHLRDKTRSAVWGMFLTSEGEQSPGMK